jgi:hypothetical protein
MSPIKLVSILCTAVLFTQCQSNEADRSIDYETISPIKQGINPGNWVPYRDASKNWGYFDRDTDEIVIKAKYKAVYPFVGGFTSVKLQNGENAIINSYEKIIQVGKFDNAYFFSSESGKTVIAILAKEKPGLAITNEVDSIWEDYLYNPDCYEFIMVNLMTGEIIVYPKNRYLVFKVETIGDYFRIDETLYQFLDNGSVECVAHDKRASIAILDEYFEKRGIPVAYGTDWLGNFTVDYTPYIDRIYANPDFTGAFDDFSSNIDHQYENTRKTVGFKGDSDGFTYGFDLTFDTAEPLYRDPRKFLNAPIEITGDRIYIMKFSGERRKSAIGLYNETKKEWEERPYSVITSNNNREVNFCLVKKFYPKNNVHEFFMEYAFTADRWDIIGVGHRGFLAIYNIDKNSAIWNEYFQSEDTFDRLLFPNHGSWYWLNK